MRHEVEVNEIGRGRRGERAAQELGAEQIEQIENGWADGFAAPFGQRQEIVGAAEAAGFERSQQKQAVGGNLELRQAIDGFGIADLAFGDANEGFFVAVIALDFPSIDVGLDESFERKAEIGANQESGIAVEQLRTVAKAVAEGFDDQQTKRTFATGFAPENVFDDFDFEGLQFSGGKSLDL